MKRLRNRRSVVTRVPESEPPKSWTSRLTTGLYVLALLGVVAAGLYLLLTPLLFARSRGTVLVESTTVSTPRAGEVAHLRALEGDSVVEGEVLASVRPARVCDAPDPGRRLQLEMEASRDSVALSHVRRRLAAQEEELESLRTQRALELAPGYTDRRRAVTRELEDLRERGEVLEASMAFARAYADSLRQAEAFDPACRSFNLFAPHDGVVEATFRRAHESLSAGEPLLAVAPTDPEVAVFAHFEPDEYEVFPVGGAVEVILPDDTEETGIVERRFASAEQFPSLKWDGYEPVPSLLLVKIVPETEAQAARWRGFDGLTVDVRRRR